MDNTNINPWTHQIVLGTLLGSGYLQRARRQFYLGFSESRDRTWFEYKALELAAFAAPTPVGHSRGVYKWRSRSLPWVPYRAWFYDPEGNPRVVMDVLDQLRDIGLAVWFGDKGFWYSNRRVGLRSKQYTSTAITYFNEVGMGCEEREGRPVFTRVGTERFLGTIAHTLPSFMYYRLSPS